MDSVAAPLADRLRPRSFDDLVGQGHLVGPMGPLRRSLQADAMPSMIFWGPPGSGKTTLALLIGQETGATFHHLSAVLSGTADLKKLVAGIEAQREGLFATKHILFVDEIHRWNKAQQDALLPFVEHGTVTLIGATTENPSFEVIGPLLSRCRVFCVKPLTHEQLAMVADRALQTLERQASEDALHAAIQMADGDARQLINILDLAVTCQADAATPLSEVDVSRAMQQRILPHDKQGEAHYNLISAFIKSMRGSDPDAALYYLARMYEAGEDPRFIARRMVIFASEDISNADAQALPMAVAAFQAFDIIGKAEGWIPLSHVVTYLAMAPKSNASYVGYKAAKADVEQHGALPVPLHLRNAPTKLMKALDYGKDYKYAHADPEGSKQQTYLPDALVGRRYYCPKR